MIQHLKSDFNACLLCPRKAQLGWPHVWTPLIITDTSQLQVTLVPESVLVGSPGMSWGWSLRWRETPPSPWQSNPASFQIISHVSVFSLLWSAGCIFSLRGHPLLPLLWCQLRAVTPFSPHGPLALSLHLFPIVPFTPFFSLPCLCLLWLFSSPDLAKCLDHHHYSEVQKGPEKLRWSWEHRGILVELPHHDAKHPRWTNGMFPGFRPGGLDVGYSLLSPPHAVSFLTEGDPVCSLHRWQRRPAVPSGEGPESACTPGVY